MRTNHILIATTLLLLSACGGAAASGAGSEGLTSENAAQYEGAIASDDLATGAARFDAVCMACHDGDAPALNNLGWTVARMRQQIREGEDEMPPIPSSRLSSEELEAVLAHLVTIGAVQE